MTGPARRRLGVRHCDDVEECQHDEFMKREWWRRRPAHTLLDPGGFLCGRALPVDCPGDFTRLAKDWVGSLRHRYTLLSMYCPLSRPPPPPSGSPVGRCARDDGGCDGWRRWRRWIRQWRRTWRADTLRPPPGAHRGGQWPWPPPGCTRDGHHAATSCIQAIGVNFSVRLPADIHQRTPPPPYSTATGTTASRIRVRRGQSDRPGRYGCRQRQCRVYYSIRGRG